MKRSIRDRQVNVNDEWYTTKEHVEFIFNNYLNNEDFTDKIIYCPADSDESEFVKYLKANKLRLKYKELWYTSDDWKNHKDLFDNCDYMITNPPFSLIYKELSKLMKDFKGKFFFFGSNYNLASYWKQFHHFENFKILSKTDPVEIKYNNCDKLIRTVYCTNIDCNSLRDNTIYTNTFDNIKEKVWIKPRWSEDEILNIDMIKNIPCDYYEMMSVPISILYDFNIWMFDVVISDSLVRNGSKEKYSDGKNRFERSIVKIKDKYMKVK